MAGFGNNGFPFAFGSPKAHGEQLRQALVDEYAPVLDVSDGTIAAIEAEAEAYVVAMVWAASERLSNQSQALRMIEALPIWEAACGLNPGPRESARERRNALAAKFRGYAGNRESDLRDVCQASLGTAFVALHHVAPAEAHAYWPGINPGPPGFEWMTNRSMVIAKVSKGGLGDAEFKRRIARMVATVDDVLAGDCAFAWSATDTVGGVDGFFLGRSRLGLDGL